MRQVYNNLPVVIIQGPLKGLVGYLRVDEGEWSWIRIFEPDGEMRKVTVPNDYYVILDEDLINFGRFWEGDIE